MSSSNFASFLVSLLALKYLSSFLFSFSPSYTFLFRLFFFFHPSFLFYFSLSSSSFFCFFSLVPCSSLCFISVFSLSSCLFFLISLFFLSVLFLSSSFSLVSPPYFLVLPVCCISIFLFFFCFSPSFILSLCFISPYISTYFICSYFLVRTFCFISPNPLLFSFVMLLLSLFYSSPSCSPFFPFISFISCSLDARPYHKPFWFRDCPLSK